MIYLDAAATAKYNNIDDIIIDTMITAMKDSWQNPSSLYATNIKDKINKCRANIAKFINANSEEIYFTSGASESNNWAIRGWVDANVYKHYLSVVTTRIEHKSIIESVKSISSSANVFYCDVDKFGLISCEVLEEILYHCEGRLVLVSIHMANNEIGTLQNVKKISELIHKYGGILHVDATQALGHIPINVEELGIDMMSCSGHKISPVLRGIGFLYKKNDISIQPLIYGAQENGLRGGTENTYGIIGLSKALEYCDVNTRTLDILRRKRDYFIDSLKFVFDCKVNGHGLSRLPNNINVTFPQNITGESLLYMLDLSGIKVSVASACNAKSIKPSYVLKEIGLSDEESMRTVRFTLPNDITYQEIDYVIDEIEKSIKLLEMN